VRSRTQIGAGLDMEYDDRRTQRAPSSDSNDSLLSKRQGRRLHTKSMIDIRGYASERSFNEIPMRKNSSRSNKRGANSRPIMAKMTEYEQRCLEVTLAEACIRDNLTDEEVVYKFFSNINMFPQKKDYFIRDFDDFYFKIRPKFSSKLIKILLEGDLGKGILGLFYLISEIEESYLSACSTL